MDKQRGRPVLVEFWDFCRVNSLRTLPYLQRVARALRRRRAAGDRRPHRRLPARARHRGGARRGRAARHRVSRRGRRAAGDLGLLRQRGLARALPVGPARRAVLPPLRRGRLRGDRARDPGAARGRAPARSSRCAPRTPRACCCPAQTADQPGAYSGPYEAGGVWAVLEGERRGARRTGARSRSTGPAATRCVEHPHHTAGVLDARGRRRRRPATRRASRRGSQLRVGTVAQQPDEPRRAARPRRPRRCPGQ